MMRQMNVINSQYCVRQENIELKKKELEDEITSNPLNFKFYDYNVIVGIRLKEWIENNKN